MEKDKGNLLSNEESILKSFSSENGFSELRKAAYSKWRETEKPSTRDEYWKYTRLGPVLNRTYKAAEISTSTEILQPKEKSAINLVFINGCFSAENSDEVRNDELTVTSLKKARAEKLSWISTSFDEEKQGDYFSLLNKAFHLDGPLIRIGKNFNSQKTIKISHHITESNRLFNIRGYILAESGSKATLVENWICEDSNENLITSCLNIKTRDDSNLEIIKSQSGGKTSALICQDFSTVERDGNLKINTLSFSGKLIRNNITVRLVGSGARCELNGLYLGTSEDHIDNHTSIEHAVPSCESSELYKGIMGGKSRAVFNGKVTVERDAQKTNAFQYNGNILLSDDAQVYSKPELEIYADDVKCSHGSTTGQLDEEALFYLETRGLNRKKAKLLLVEAFAQEVLEKIGDEEARRIAGEIISGRFHEQS